MSAAHEMALWGGVDQLAVVLNLALGLGLHPRREVGFGKKAFLLCLRSKAPLIADVWEEEDIQKWLSALREIRHYVSHRGTAEVRIVVDANSPIPSDEELLGELKSTGEYERMQCFLKESEFRSYLHNRLHLLRVSKFKVIRDDLVFVQASEDSNSYMTNAIHSIDWNFDNYRKAIVNSLKLLHGQLGGDT